LSGVKDLPLPSAIAQSSYHKGYSPDQ
jgi:hypothetical protein